MKKLVTVVNFILIFLLLLLSNTGCAADTKGRIAFRSSEKREKDTYIFSMNPDGSDLVELARWDPSSMPYRNVWSADGKTLAYIDYDEGAKEAWLAVVDADGKNRRRVRDVTEMRIGSMALSPDGKTIVISADSTRVTRIETPVGNTVRVDIIKEEDMDLFTVNVQTGELRRLTDTSGGVIEKFPSYSPDGRQIAFVERIDTDTPQRGDVFVMDADGGNRRLLAHHADGWFVINPEFRWSPDGSKIAYAIYNMPEVNRMSVSDSDHHTDVLVLDVKAGLLTNLTDTDSPYVVNIEPAWSPDGRKIAFISGNVTEGFPSLVRVVDGEDTVELDQRWPAWTPDGKGLIFTNPINVFELMLIDADGKNPRTLAVVEGIPVSNPIWLGGR
ncbi:MAG: PD40 domain-containing protein [Chloroflexi bacterium]|nr:PD40 domain-containing protein [Chloroflexota bacterium]